MQTPNIKQAYQHCHAILKKSQSSFTYGLLCLPKSKRQAMTAIYAFCRIIDDIVDAPAVHPVHLDAPEKKLHNWQMAIDTLFQKNRSSSNSSDPVIIALADVIKHYPLEKKYFDELLAGMKMDLDKPNYQTFDDLRQYCFRVASCVGLLSIPILDSTNKRSVEFATQLGLAFQLTNILRDIKEDANRGRVYLPKEELAKFGLTPDTLLNNTQPDKTAEYLNFYIQRAHQYYDNAFRALTCEDLKHQKAAMMMANMYLAILEKIEQNPTAILTKRIKLSFIEKLWIAIKTLCTTR